MGPLSLEIVEGPDSGRRVGLPAPLEIGRARDVGLALNDRLVSRRHARITPSGSAAIVEDLGSRNGTFVNGNEVQGLVRVGPGDQLVLGVTLLELRTARQIAERPSAVHAVPPPLAAPVRPPDYVPGELLDDLGNLLDDLGPTVAEPTASTLDPLLDARAKGKARTAPLAVFVLVVLVVLIYLATR
ncbi:MAG TPA: FHA domain-containing protein [Actinomycetes bacterium]|nr:FHA domain-containing protein [Actinomycetes bacterium]